MTTDKALKRLEELGVDPIKVGSIRIQHGQGGIAICLAVTSIINNYRSSDANEQEVSSILKLVLRRHFK